MYQEKNNLLAYLLDAPNKEQNVAFKELDGKRNIVQYTQADFITHTANLGQYLANDPTVGTNVPMFMETSYDFLRSFMGIVAAQKIVVPIHTIASDEAIDFILRKVRATSVIVTEVFLYQKLIKLPYVCESIQTIFCTPTILSQQSLPCRHIDIFEIFTRPQEVSIARQYLENVVACTNRDDTMQIVFTSGTTGEPKGAILSHRNVISCVVRAGNHLKIDSSYRTLTFLPLSHVMAQNEVFIALVAKALVQFVNRDNLLYGLKNFRPNILVSVPRVYQAIHHGIQKKLRHNNVARKLLELVLSMHLLRKSGKNIWQKIIGFLFSTTIGKIVTFKVRQNIGQFKLLVTAGAACPSNIYEFFEAIGMPLTNAQGLTEVSGAIIYNTRNETLNGSIGYPLPGVQVKIDEDGEILMKGDPVFSGYFEDPQQNAHSITQDGWFRTGDIGEIKILRHKLYVFLKGRKKEILVLSSGLNVPACQIEDRLVQHEIIQQAMVIGDGKPRLAALIVPHSEYAKRPNLREEITNIIRNLNSKMDASEQIGDFEILPEPFTVENGMLTPTLKVRRMVVSQKYENLIGKLYQTAS